MSFNPHFQPNKTLFSCNQSSSSMNSSSSSSSSISQHCPPNEPKEKRHTLPELLNLKKELAGCDDSAVFEGVTSNIKQILKHLHELKDPFSKEEDTSKPHRLAATILTTLDDIRPRIELICSRHSGRRPSSDHPLSPRSPKLRPPATLTEDYQKLRRELSASLSARKSLERMISSLSREKEMIANELARKVQEFSGMEELVNDMRADNSKLTEKLGAWLEGGSGGRVELEMREKNKELGEKLLKALDGYKMAKRKLREEKEENLRMREEVEVVIERMRMVREGEWEMVELKQLEMVLMKLVKAGLPPP